MTEIKQGKVNSFLTNQYFVGGASAASIISLFYGWMADGYGKFVALVIFLFFAGSLMYNVISIIKEMGNKFHTLSLSINQLDSNVTCVHNCKNQISGDIGNVRSLVENITEKVKKTPETLEFINIDKNKYIIIINDHESKNYKIALKGRYADKVGIKNAISMNDVESAILTVSKKEYSLDNDVEVFFDFQSKPGINIGIIELQNKNANEEIHVNFKIQCTEKTYYTNSSLRVA